MPRDEFRSQLELALARIAFTSKRWGEAEQRYGEVLARYPESKAAPEALYWKGVSNYKATNDHTALGQLAEEFKQKYSDTIWALKTVAWTH